MTIRAQCLRPFSYTNSFSVYAFHPPPLSQHYLSLFEKRKSSAEIYTSHNTLCHLHLEALQRKWHKYVIFVLKEAFRSSVCEEDALETLSHFHYSTESVSRRQHWFRYERMLAVTRIVGRRVILNQWVVFIKFQKKFLKINYQLWIKIGLIYFP